MSPRSLKIALAVSVALNLFAVAAGVTVWTGFQRHEARVSEMRAPAQRGPLRDILTQMDPVVRDRVRETLRDSARAAKPDFEAAGAARRRAVELAAAPSLDPMAVKAALDESRNAELRARARLEADTVALLQTLEPADRAALSKLLNRRGGRGDGPKGRDGHGPRGDPDQGQERKSG